MGSDAGAALESLAEDGSPMMLVAEHDGAADTEGVGAATDPVSDPGNAGPIMPGMMYEFTVSPSTTAPNLTIAAMVVWTNDVFMATRPQGIPLLKPDGTPRSAEMIEADFARHFVVLDAGTEANEIPGFGRNQAPTQEAAGQGDADPLEMGVSSYHDWTNDLMGASVGGRLSVTVTDAGDGSFDVVVENSSEGTTVENIFTPVLWALQAPGANFFEMGTVATAGLESLSEYGDPSVWAAALTDGGVTHGVMSMVSASEPVRFTPANDTRATSRPRWQRRCSTWPRWLCRRMTPSRALVRPECAC
ncbi:MAG: hypothetical protein ACI9OJ_000170 [Myxococcota bacterium]|jgi:hypothetical protein